MSRSVYVSWFLLFSFLFVPVFCFYGILSMIGPLWAHFIIVFGHIEFTNFFAFELVAFSIQLPIYFLIFYWCARISFRLSQCFSSRWRMAFQIVVLSVIFCFSFLEINGGTAFVNWIEAGDVWDMFSAFLKNLRGY